MKLSIERQTRFMSIRPFTPTVLKDIINRDYETFSGLMLERYFKRVLIESKEYTRIGSWWDRKEVNEIDIMAENELDQQVLFIEVKRKIENCDPELLKTKKRIIRFWLISGMVAVSYL